MRFAKTREALTQHIKPTREAFATVALAEVAVAEDIAKALSTLIEAHWSDAPHETVRKLVRHAETLLVKVGG